MHLGDICIWRSGSHFASLRAAGTYANLRDSQSLPHSYTNGAHGPHSHFGLLFREGWNLGNFVSSGIWQGSGQGS
jgi:hypothetical protein